MCRKFRSENLKGRGLLEHLDVDERIMLKRILKHGQENLNWIHLAQDRVQWRAVVITVMNRGVP
jgi:hypothetical protein